MKHLLIISFIFAQLLARVSAADFECFSDVSYKWKKGPELITPAPTPGEEITFEWGRVRGRGKDEADAKLKLAEALQDAKGKALSECKQAHESTADCLAAKYASMSSTINSLRFEARKSLEQAISADCALQKGSCTGVSATDAQCAEKASASAATTPAAGAAAGAGKDAKGAAKKK